MTESWDYTVFWNGLVGGETQKSNGKWRKFKKYDYLIL
jgi:hypothetical protein